MTTMAMKMKAVTTACELVGSLYKDRANPQKALPILGDAQRVLGKVAPIVGDFIPGVGDAVAIFNAVAACATALVPDRVARWNRRTRDLGLEGFEASTPAAEYALEDMTMEIAGFNRDLPVVHNAFMHLGSGDRHLSPDDAERDNPNKPRGNKKWTTRQLKVSRYDDWLIQRDGAIYKYRRARWQAAALLALLALLTPQGFEAYIRESTEFADEAVVTSEG